VCKNPKADVCSLGSQSLSAAAGFLLSSESTFYCRGQVQEANQLSGRIKCCGRHDDDDEFKT